MTINLTNEHYFLILYNKKKVAISRIAQFLENYYSDLLEIQHRYSFELISISLKSKMALGFFHDFFDKKIYFREEKRLLISY